MLLSFLCGLFCSTGSVRRGARELTDLTATSKLEKNSVIMFAPSMGKNLQFFRLPCIMWCDPKCDPFEQTFFFHSSELNPWNYKFSFVENSMFYRNFYCFIPLLPTWKSDISLKIRFNSFASSSNTKLLFLWKNIHLTVRPTLPSKNSLQSFDLTR